MLTQTDPVVTPPPSFNIIDAIYNTTPAKLRDILGRLNPMGIKLKPGFCKEQSVESIAAAPWQRSHHPEINTKSGRLMVFEAPIDGNADVVWLYDDILIKMSANEDVELTLKDEGDGNFSLVYPIPNRIPVESMVMVIGPDPNAANLLVVHDIYVGEPVKPSAVSSSVLEDIEQECGKTPGEKISGKLAYSLGWDYVQVEYTAG